MAEKNPPESAVNIQSEEDAFREELKTTKDRVSFVPIEFSPRLIEPMADGRKFMHLCLNGVDGYLVINELNEDIPRPFYELYKSLLNDEVAAEKFRRFGPKNAVWNEQTPIPVKTWFYTKEALTFGISPYGGPILLYSVSMDQDMPWRQVVGALKKIILDKLDQKINHRKKIRKSKTLREAIRNHPAYVTRWSRWWRKIKTARAMRKRK